MKSRGKYIFLIYQLFSRNKTTYSFKNIKVSHWHYFLLTWKTVCSISCIADMLVTNSLIFVYLKMYLFHPWRIFFFFFAGHKTYNLQFYFIQCFTDVVYFLASVVDEKPIVIRIEVPQYIRQFSSGSFQDILFIFDFQYFNFNESGHVFFHIYLP